MNRYVQYMYSYPHKTAYRPLDNVNLIDYMGNLAGEGHSLYLHLPFCESKCGYCNLFSVAGCGGAQRDAYLDVLPRQMEQYREILPCDTVFGDFTIGGRCFWMSGSWNGCFGMSELICLWGKTVRSL